MSHLVVGPQVQEMFGSIANRYDRANTVLSFGIHFWWRWLFLRSLPAQTDARVLDICTGTGDLIPGLSARFTEVVGIDFCMQMLSAGESKWKGLSNVLPCQGDGLRLPIANQCCDLVTVAFGVRNFENLDVGLKEIHRVLKPGGQLRILEFGQPQGKVWGRFFRFYSDTIMPLLGGLITGNRAAYKYLPNTSRLFPCREEFVRILTSVGFTDCACNALSGGISYIYRASA